MKPKFTENKLIEVFCFCDDVCKVYESWLKENPEQPMSCFRGKMAASEVATIMVLYHFSGYKCFKYYYNQVVEHALKTYFPNLCSYSRFVSYMEQMPEYVYAMMKAMASSTPRTETYFIDSKPLAVCHNKRIHNNKVFKHIAERGKSSLGWFYGLKLHLVINSLGDIVSFEVTPGNVADNNKNLLRRVLDGLGGECYGDKGYLTGLFKEFHQKGLTLITKVKKNMKNRLITLHQKLILRKRGIIESVNNLLVNTCDIEHTRHRSFRNAFAHIFSALLAYSFLDNKPALILQQGLCLPD